MKFWLPRLLVFLVLLVLIVLAIVYRDKVADKMEKFMQWVRNHRVLGPVILILVYILATIFFIPGSILTIGAGWAF